jgi:16S rRNA A1518/A1519 N6-dimethyltransferase RsmA/KsgA/DIM1 with predicted DNA glycosylase/AP lyase activity
MDAEEEARLRNLVRAVFQWRRKQLRRILHDHSELRFADTKIDAALAATGAAPEDRPERLSPEQFIRLARALR